MALRAAKIAGHVALALLLLFEFVVIFSISAAGTYWIGRECFEFWFE